MQIPYQKDNANYSGLALCLLCFPSSDYATASQGVKLRAVRLAWVPRWAQIAASGYRTGGTRWLTVL